MMDPNTARTNLIQAANTALALAGQSLQDVDLEHLQSTTTTLAESVLELDEWLRSGGFLPSEWTTGGDQRTRKQDFPTPETVQTHRTGGPCTALVTVRRHDRTFAEPCALDQGHHGACVPKEANG